MEIRRIAFIAGSESDFWQMFEGMEILLKYEAEGKVELFKVHPASQHRRPLTVQSILFEYSKMSANKKPHFIITSAGWANHLSGCSDAFLRYTLGDETIVVIAVAMRDPENDDHTQSAIKSTTEVPGIQAIFKDLDGNPLVGSKGYAWAAEYSATTEVIPTVKAKEPPPYEPWDPVDVVRVGKEQLMKRMSDGKAI